MPLTVRDLLDLPVLVRARPEVVVGDRLGERPVRWVHTSEIYEISPLLKGGEALLTTGLGLVGLGPPALAEYVAALARQGVAVLLLEVGRTFTDAPPPLVAAARRHALPLVLLHGVVPFIEVTETVYPLLIAGEVEQLRAREHASGRLHDALAAGATATELVALTAELCGGPAGLYAPSGDLLAGVDVRERGGAMLEFDVGRDPWAVLTLVASPGTAGPVASGLPTLCATVLDIRLGAGAGLRQRPGADADLVRALARGHYLSGADVVSRSRRAGLVVRPGWRAVGVAVELGLPRSVRPGLDATAVAARAVFGTSLVAEVDGAFLVATTVRPAELRSRLGALADALESELRATVGPGTVRVAAGPAVEDAAGLARSLPAAGEALRLAGRLGLGSRAVLATDLGVYHLLSDVAADAELERFVQDQLGPLLEHDARHGSDLVHTLDAFLEAGLSKTGAAQALGIRRQTLYSRLERASRLLGGLDLETRQARTALDLALVSWRMRSSAVTRRP